MAIAQHPTTRARHVEGFCVFERGGFEFAVPVASTGQVLSGQRPEPLPGSPGNVIGMLDALGGKIPVVIADQWLDLAEQPYRESDQILFLESGDFRIGLVVDRVRDVRMIDANTIEPAPPEVTAGGAALRGAWERDGRRILVLDPTWIVDEALVSRDSIAGWERIDREAMQARPLLLGAQDYCIFQRGGRDFGMPIAVAREMLSPDNVVRVPQAPPSLVGVINLRGEILPLIVIDRWIQVPTRALSVSDQIVVLESPEMNVGIIVDRVRDVRSIEQGAIRPDGGASANRVVQGLWSTEGESVTILHPQRLLDAAVDTISSGFEKSALTAGVGASGGAAPA